MLAPAAPLTRLLHAAFCLRWCWYGRGSDKQLYETYHGVYVNVQYLITVDMTRGMMAKNVKKSKEFMVEIEAEADFKKQIGDQPFAFKVSPDSLQNVKEVLCGRFTASLFVVLLTPVSIVRCMRWWWVCLLTCR